MKPENYAQVLLRLLTGGDAPKEAVTKLHTLLTAQGRTDLFPAIGRAFERRAEEESRKTQTRLYVAHKADAAHALKESHAPHAEVVIDESLIGGWRLEAGEMLQDASWKKHLLTIYQNTTRA